MYKHDQMEVFNIKEVCYLTYEPPYKYKTECLRFRGSTVLDWTLSLDTKYLVKMGLMLTRNLKKCGNCVDKNLTHLISR